MQAGGLYVHVPFCDRVCPYCDFAVQTGGERKRAEYLRALVQEIRGLEAPPYPIDTVYLGGGTPSVLQAPQLARILDLARDALRVDPKARIMLEANPEDVSITTLRSWRRLGVTSLSLGVQSFDDRALEFLGRAHRGVDAVAAVEAATEAGLDVVSVDLIFGLPGQTAADWRRQIEQALQLRPDHLSCYQLTIHEGTRFGKQRRRGELVELAESRQSELFLLAHELLVGAGFEHYEVSNYAANAAHRSTHNQRYWQHAPYLGLGPSAHSFDGERRRWWNHRRLRDYTAALAVERGAVDSSELLSPAQLALEAVMFGMRCSDGLDLARVRRRFGVDLAEANRTRFLEWERQGWVSACGDVVAPTASGMAIAEHLAGEIVIPADAATSEARSEAGE